MSENFVENKQIIILPLSGLFRVIAKRDNSIRFQDRIETKKGPTAVLNFTVLKFASDGDDDAAPVYIDVSLWGDQATEYKDLVADGQTCFIDGLVKIVDNSYDKENVVYPTFKGKVSISGRRQFKLFPGVVKPDKREAPETASEPALPDPASIDDVPF